MNFFCELIAYIWQWVILTIEDWLDVLCEP